jgi:hypothetical protein
MKNTSNLNKFASMLALGVVLVAVAIAGSPASAQTQETPRRLGAPGNSTSKNRVTYSNYATCAKARPGHANCLAIRRNIFVNGIRQHSLTPATGTSFGATALRKAYGIRALGTRRKVLAIVDAMHSGTAFADLTEYRSMYSLGPMDNCGVSGEQMSQLPSGKYPCFVQLDQTGAVNQNPGTTDNGWAQEIALDLDMASAACPHCSIVLVEAKTSSFADLAAAVAVAANFQDVAAISNSYGGPDVVESRVPQYAAASAAGIAAVASSGDSGYGVSAPASFSSVIGVGGTALFTDETGAWSSEQAWASGGSGCSLLNVAPAWQDPAVTGCPGKSVVDVAAVADPATGVSVYYDGQWFSFGGTSAAAPLIAGLFAVKKNFGSSAGAYLWQNRASLHDISIGSNGRCRPLNMCNAGVGFDGNTGWGSPNGTGAF